MDFEMLDKALDCLLPKKKFEVLQFIYGIFCLSKISFQAANEKCSVFSTNPVDLAANLFSIDSEELKNALTSRIITVPGENGEKIRYKHKSL